MNIGCHAVLFTDKIATDTEMVLKHMKETGCSGVEIGARFFGVEKSGYLKEMLDAYGLQLSGLHVSVKWTDLLDDYEKVVEAVGKAVEFLQVMTYKNIILTGIVSDNPSAEVGVEKDARLLQPDQVKAMAVRFNELAREAGKRGVSLNYHNHCWEFEEDALLFKTLLSDAPEMEFALDTGWAAAGGYDGAELISQYPSRFHYVHLRDFQKEVMDNCHTFAEKQEGFTELGQGDVDYKRLMEVLEDNLGDNGWAVVEYEKGPVNFGRYKAAVDFLKNMR